MFFQLFTFPINLWHWKFVTAASLQCLSTINMVFSDEDKILIKILIAISMGKDLLFYTPKVSKFVDE